MSDKTSYPLVRTLRFKSINSPGMLGRITTAIGKTGTLIGNISMVHFGNRYVVRDIEVIVEGRPHMARVLRELIKIPEVKVVEIRDAVLELHKNGLVSVVPTRQIESAEDIRKLYFPGSREVCTLINDNDTWKDTYTGIPYNVAIATNGTSVFDFPSGKPVTAMPIVEAKAALLNRLAGINGFPIILDAPDTRSFVDALRPIASAYSGIQVSNVSSKHCFDIVPLLEDELHLPVIHDDQQGNATVITAALINACKACEMDFQNAKIGVIGLGVTGLAIARFVRSYTGNTVWGSTLSEESAGRHRADGGILSSIEDIMANMDIVIATTSRGNIISSDMVRKGQIILALSEPQPEIDPAVAMESGACLAINSKAINNLLCCPGLWRGTLDAQAQTINFDMYKAAAHAIAESATEGEILPTTLDKRVHHKVTHAVARAAVTTGMARRKLDDDYFENPDILKAPWM